MPKKKVEKPVEKERTRYPMSPRLLIDVTAERIRASKDADSSKCMIAESVRAAFPRAKDVAVDLQTIRFSDPRRGLRYVYLTPIPAAQALINFDQEILPDPFLFKLRGAHVLAMGASYRNRVTPGRRMHRDPNKARKHKARMVLKKKLRKARLVPRHDAVGLVPDRVGGQAPPLSEFAKARAFGLRALARPTDKQLAKWGYVKAPTTG